MQIESDRFTQEAEVAKLKAERTLADLEAHADSTLADAGLVPEITRRRSLAKASELGGRAMIEQRRLDLSANAAKAPGAVEEAEIAKLEASLALKREQVAALHVRAGIEGVLQQLGETQTLQVGQRVSPAATPTTPTPSAVLFGESFEDARLRERGWYDGSRFTISTNPAHGGKGCLDYTWKAGRTNPDNSSGIRRLFEPSDSVYLRCYLRLSKGWDCPGRDYHPHLMPFMTTENGPYHGPAGSHFALYIEPPNGQVRLDAKDIQNKDQPHGLNQGPLRGGYNGRL